MKKTNLMILTSIVFLSTFAIGTAAQAETILRIPIFIEGDTPLPAAEVNELLKATTAAPIPLFIEISDKEKNAYKVFQALDKKIGESLETLGGDWAVVSRSSESVPGSNNNEDLITCYVGDGNRVAEIVDQLADIAYSDQLGIIGTKFKASTVINYPEDATEYLNEESKLWKNWKGDDESVLILSHVSDGGDDVNESLIPVCAN